MIGFADLVARFAAELALFAGVGFLLFALNDIAVDLIYFGRRMWRSITVYSRYPRAFATSLKPLRQPSFIAIFVPAWDESQVIGAMLRSTLKRLDHTDYRIFVGHYRNDPATQLALSGIADDRVETVEFVLLEQGAPLPAFPKEVFHPPEGEPPVAAQRGLESAPLILDDAEADYFRRGAKRLIVYSKMSYRDIYSPEERWTETCLELTHQGGTIERGGKRMDHITTKVVGPQNRAV